MEKTYWFTTRLGIEDIHGLRFMINKLSNVLLLSLCFCANSTLQGQGTNSSAPILFQHIVRRDPNYSIHVVKINLKDPHVSVHVARGGADPDGDGPWLATLLPTSEIAEREHYSVAINGDFFEAFVLLVFVGCFFGFVC